MQLTAGRTWSEVSLMQWDQRICDGGRAGGMHCVTTVLGVIQVMVGLFNVGLGPGRTHVRPGDVAGLWAAYWLGTVYAVVGLFTIVSGTCPSCPCLGRTSAFMNIFGAIFAVTGVVLYALDLAHASIVWMCDRSLTSDPCRNVAFFGQRLLTWMDITLLVLVVLQLCVNISAAVLAFRITQQVCRDQCQTAHQKSPA